MRNKRVYICHCIDAFDLIKLFLSLADIDECASSPCKNGGTCIDLNAEWTDSSDFTVGYACQCMAGYTGNQCETSMISYFGVFLLFSLLISIRRRRMCHFALSERWKLHRRS